MKNVITPLRLALLFTWLASMAFMHLLGQDKMAQLVIDSHEREVWYGQICQTLLDSSVMAMSVVLREDVYLHAEIRRIVPGWQEAVMHARRATP